MSVYASLSFFCGVAGHCFSCSRRRINGLVDCQECAYDFRVELDPSPVDQKLFCVGRVKAGRQERSTVMDA